MILAMNVGQSPDVTRCFTLDLGSSYEVGLDEDAEVAPRYCVIGLPLTYFIDRHGKVRSRLLWKSRTETFEEIADPFPREPPP